jgi:hypothetical protein
MFNSIDYSRLQYLLNRIKRNTKHENKKRSSLEVQSIDRNGKTKRQRIREVTNYSATQSPTKRTEEFITLHCR